MNSNLIKPWLIRLPIKNDEIFSSWFTRLAMRNGCDVLDISSYLWDKWRIWANDVDRNMDEHKINGLLVACGIEYKDIKNAFLYSHSNLISNDHAQAVWPWILSLGCRNRKRYSGMQFCPECLNEDEYPYFRVHWRFAWNTCCNNHKIRLLDRCPNCSAAIEFHRLEAEASHLNYCASCQYDLRLSTQIRVDEKEIKIQRACDSVHQTGFGCFGSQKIDTEQWFLTFRFFIMLIQKARNPNLKSIHKLLNKIGIDSSLIYFSPTGLRLELLRVNERAQLLRQSFQLLSMEPDDFQYALNHENINARYLKNVMNPLPTKINKMVAGERKLYSKRNYNEQKYKPKSKRTVLLMYERLKRRLDNIDR